MQNGWNDIPAADVTELATGDPIGSWDVALTGGETERLSWDVQGTLGTSPSPIQVRMLVDSIGSAPVTVEFDPDITGAAAPVGPVHVDLLSGNVGLTSLDVTIPGLQVSRTHNSRRPDAGANGGLFGDGWESGLNMTSPWRSLTHDEDTGVVRIMTGTGESVFFTERADGAFARFPPDLSLVSVDA